MRENPTFSLGRSGITLCRWSTCTKSNIHYTSKIYSESVKCSLRVAAQTLATPVDLPSQTFTKMSSSGTIKKFFEDKGFGFITPDDGSEDVFAHVKECPELEGAQQGDAVTYDTKWDDRKGKNNATNFSKKDGGGGGGGGGGSKGGGKGYSPW